MKKVGEQASIEARYYMQRPENKRTALVMRAPNADLARDPRWGRTEESFGEDPFLTARLTVANIEGLQGDNPRYWRTAALMKHFLANSNEDRRDSTSSDFDMRLFYEYYAYPFIKVLRKPVAGHLWQRIMDGMASRCVFILAWRRLPVRNGGTTVSFVPMVAH